MNRIKKMLFSAAIAVLLSAYSCSKSGSDGNPPDPPPPPPPGGSTCTGTAGPLFTTVKNLVADKCLSCHNSSNSNGGMSWSDECNIVAKKDRIKQRAVVEGTMPQTGELSQTDKDKITAWLNAGGRYTD